MTTAKPMGTALGKALAPEIALQIAAAVAPLVERIEHLEARLGEGEKGRRR